MSARNASPVGQSPESGDEQHWEVFRHTDRATGVVAEVRADGVPVGLAVPPALLDRRSPDIAAAVLRTLVAAGSGARELLERYDDPDRQDGEGARW